MRQIIDGRAYDTETSELIKEVCWEADGVYGERVHRLYRTRHGAFFLYRRYEGTVVDPDSGEEDQVRSETLSPCTDEHAQEWLEKYDSGLVEQYFGEMPEGGSTERRFTLRMPSDLARRLETKAGEMPLTRYVNRCLERCVGEEGAVDAAEGRDVNAIVLRKVAEKIMNRSYQRSGVVAGGTELSSRARQATVSFTSADFRLLQLAADENGVSFSEMVRQCVRIALGAR